MNTSSELTEVAVLALNERHKMVMGRSPRSTSTDINSSTIFVRKDLKVGIHTHFSSLRCCVMKDSFESGKVEVVASNEQS